MATSPDGVLTAEFDPVRNLVSLLVAGSAWPAPGVTRVNLATPPRPIPSQALSPVRLLGTAWGDGSGTLTVTGTDADGIAAARCTTAPTSLQPESDLIASSGTITAAGGKWYGFGIQVGSVGLVQDYSPSLVWVGSGMPATRGPSYTVGALQWITFVAQAPSGTTSVRADLDYGDNPVLWAVGDGLDVRKLMIFEGDTQADVQAALDAEYFDGDTPDEGTLQRYWGGTAYTTPSIEEETAQVPDQVTITRSVDGASPVPVRGAEMVTAPGGTFVWSDNEAPLDASVVYTVQGYAGGSLVGTSTVTVETTGAAWGVWVKVPGRPELTVRAPLVALDDETRETLGGSWQIPGGPRISQSGSGALAQSAGMGALTTAVTLQAVDRTARAALDRAVRQAPGQVLLIQTGQPEELVSGYYQAGQSTWSNPAQVRSDQYAKRYLTLPITEAVMPAGPASGWTGVTYTDVTNAFATYQAIADAELTYMDLATGEGWT